uniref:ARAD1C26048p n=1 Tax=Blastobotrys adeninivorans TaxID=409370 RepID=A0A060T759_BLAAD
MLYGKPQQATNSTMLSNIAQIFNPPTGDSAGSGAGNGSKDGKNDKGQDPCWPCLLTSSAAMILGGTYMASGAVFASSAAKPLPKGATPAWQRTVRYGGFAVILLGVFRGIEGIMVATGNDPRNPQPLFVADKGEDKNTK